MIDEFAKHARLQRQLNKIQEELKHRGTFLFKIAAIYFQIRVWSCSVKLFIYFLSIFFSANARLSFNLKLNVGITYLAQVLMVCIKKRKCFAIIFSDSHSRILFWNIRFEVRTTMLRLCSSHILHCVVWYVDFMKTLLPSTKWHITFQKMVIIMQVIILPDSCWLSLPFCLIFCCNNVVHSAYQPYARWEVTRYSYQINEGSFIFWNI